MRLAADGVEALDECAAAFPDLMILDLVMPRLDGFGLIGELQERGRRPLFPIFVLTARRGACDQLDATTPVEECVQKPFDMDEILAKVHRLISD